MGFRLSHGQYLAFLDADDVWHPEMLERCVAILNQMPGLGAVHTNWLPINEVGELLSHSSGWQPWRGDIFARLPANINLVSGECCGGESASRESAVMI